MMSLSVLSQLAAIVVTGVFAQWLAWRVGLPSILLLLLSGLILGPMTGWIDPDFVFGGLLQPFVSIAVALILYEGGLTLKLSELPKLGGVVQRLVTLGALITGLVTYAAARLVLKMDPALSLLLAAVLVVTGPTVITPLLRHIRPMGSVGSVLKWEGIVIDPIGALITVLLFEVVLTGEARDATAHIVHGVVLTAAVGGGLGAVAGAVLILLLCRYWIPDYLQNSFSVMLVVATFTLANAVQHEAGLLAVTVMGFVLANQKKADVQHIVEFKENLQVLLISTLFVVLAARLRPPDLGTLLAKGLPFVLILILVARPLAVFLSTIGSSLTIRQRLFMGWMAPRGIVAAAIASVMAIKLEGAGFAEAHLLVQMTFITIIATVVVYGLTAPWIARWLKVSESNPQGVLFVGAHGWARAIAAALQRTGVRTLLADNNWYNVNTARMEGLTTYSGSILAEHTLDTIDLGGMGRLLSVTPNDWVNTLAVHRFERIFGKAECYQLPPNVEKSKKENYRYLHGRWLFGDEVTYPALQSRQASGFTVKVTKLSEEFTLESFRRLYGESAVLLFVLDEDKQLRVVTADSEPAPEAGQTLIALVQDSESTETRDG